MTTTTLRKKLCGYIETMPEQNLAMLKPLLSRLAAPIEPPYIIEPASPEEKAKVKRRIMEYRKDPSSFVEYKRK